MDTYKIAGLNVNMSPYGMTKERARKYKTEYVADADIEVTVPEHAIKLYLDKHPDIDEDAAYYLASGFRFYKKLLSFDGFMLHSSAVQVDDNAYLFSGTSGIGKSTHTGYWKQLLGDRCTYINDDKPALRLIDNIFYACGTPWSGKHDISENVMIPLKGLCFIKRGESNSIERLPAVQAAHRIIDQCTSNLTNEQWDTILPLIDKFVETVPVYLLRCIKDESAARLSYQTLTGEKI